MVALTTRWVTARRRGFTLGVITLGSFVGYGILGLIYPLVLARYNWRFGWTILGVSALGVPVVDGIILRNKPEDLGLRPWGEIEKPSKPSFHMLSNYRAILSRKTFWQIGIFYFFISYCYYTFISFIVTYGTAELGVQYGTVACFASFSAFGALVGSLPTATLSDSIGRSKTFL